MQGISDLITVTGLINLDFADVKAVMSNAGTALMAIGEGKGPTRAVQAAQAAIASPLLDVTVDGATGLLINVTGGPDMSLSEVSEAAQLITRAASEDANVIVGAVINPRPQAEFQVTLIATGFGGIEVRKPAPKVSDLFAKLDDEAQDHAGESGRQGPRGSEPRAPEARPARESWEVEPRPRDPFAPREPGARERGGPREPGVGEDPGTRRILSPGNG